MRGPLRGPGQRYQLAVEALVSQDGRHFTRSLVEGGIPLGCGGPPTGEASDAPPSTYLVVVDESCSLILKPGQNGVTVQDVRLLNACHVRLTAQVTPGVDPPDWLAGEGTYLLFDGDATAAVAQPVRYIPFDGMVQEETWTESDVAPLDVLAVAVARSVERANAILACREAPGGTSLVTGVTIRVGVNRVDLGPGRVLVTLARPEQGEVAQFVELTLASGLPPGEEVPGEVVPGGVGPSAVVPETAVPGAVGPGAVGPGGVPGGGGGG